MPHPTPLVFHHRGVACAQAGRIVRLYLSFPRTIKCALMQDAVSDSLGLPPRRVARAHKQDIPLHTTDDQARAPAEFPRRTLPVIHHGGSRTQSGCSVRLLCISANHQPHARARHPARPSPVSAMNGCARVRSSGTFRSMRNRTSSPIIYFFMDNQAH